MTAGSTACMKATGPSRTLVLDDLTDWLETQIK
jgi:hypothetical protein